MIEKKGAIDPVELTCLLNGTKTKEQEENYEFNDQWLLDMCLCLSGMAFTIPVRIFRTAYQIVEANLEKRRTSRIN